ncbi:penicillin-binding protein [Leptolyngbya boryana NIES-2135]|jgi:penicillin-binding protein 2|uniref:Penicillin-binding protein n=1 Tax=Leptolyngbya boryana NIES-2135 TaxID=1973484 RepID=A0A1Z4JFM6_LEPBY|nr:MULTISPECIES: penicillin-binding protein 2 [Leptolyngbya]BAY55453.1 penicillin-binding protein [Leptolyngbya boryana NIES-2135]MBD1854377.1 penicillin-binding protein 2 [Leptolyngbya sp. FACHB-1624]MBD2368395.1 penicillin-binding protein 2 [Leptolyngbya sp. FACHB-161]MBD2374949.1 penicillin-binding protein 2 [Leptolyngbya sp. FACHB-238]MBD2399369.1 penicillin-binding protein 2 [Leptolyngbya sp. FACHB-239]
MANLSVSASSWVNKARSQRSFRAVILFMLASGLMSICGFRLAYLQLVEGSRNRQLADQNRIRSISIVADRGNLIDRKGTPIVVNRLSRSVYLYPREQTKEQWQVSAEKISQLLEIPKEEILKKLEAVQYKSVAPVRILRGIDEKKYTAINEIGQIRGLEVQAESTRQYPFGSLAAHVLGYIGEATAEDLKAHPEFPNGMLVGQMGIERIQDAVLRGTWGNRLIEVDSTGRELKMLGTQQPVAGQPLQLTLDVKLQQAAERALGGRRGAVVVLDVKTGSVLTMASGPTFDPNMFTRKISQKAWDELQKKEHPFLNRALQGYPPGSTFKIVTAMAAMKSGKFNATSMLPTYSAMNIGGTLFHEHGDASYGTIGFKDALAVSSNSFFYQLGMSIGPEAIAQWGGKFGVGTTSTMGLDGASHGMIPTPKEKEKVFNEQWYVGDTVSTSIGQGMVQMTPLEMAVMVSTVANGGKRIKPHLFAHQTYQPNMQPESLAFDPAALKVLQEGLIAVVQAGTAQSLNDGSIPLTAGKTGTAEVQGQEDNSMYVGYGPANNPQIAVAVVVENGGYGATAAVPIAHEIYKAFFGVTKPKAE